MFAYCLNNPVNCYDPSGNAAFWTSTGDWNPLHSGYYGIGGAGGGGSGKSGYKDILEEIAGRTKKVSGAVASAAEYCADVYSDYQASQQLEAEMMMNAGIEMYRYLDDNGVISVGKSSYQSYKAATEFKIAAAYLLAPIPSPADEMFAIGHAIKGVYHLYMGIIEVFE